MSAEEPDSAPRRPATARTRSDPTDDGATAPLTPGELKAIERQHADLAAQAGAVTDEDADTGVTWVRFIGRAPALNYASAIRWPADEADARLADLESIMRSAGEWPVVSVAEGLAEPADLPARLAAAGWVRLASERVMFTRHAPVVPHLDPGLRIEAVTPMTAIEAVRLETTNFGLPDETVSERAERLGVLVAQGQLRGFIVRLVRDAIASARLNPTKGVAALTAVGVTARQRRRGYGRLITAVATRAGLATGHSLVWLSVDEGNTAAVELYRSLGYEPSISFSRWAAPAR